MQPGDQIVVRKELNAVGLAIAGVLSGQILYNPVQMGMALLGVGLGPAYLPLVVGLIGGAVYLSSSGRLIMSKLSKGEMYYEHHGILESSQMVIHEPGELFAFGSTSIELVPLSDFKADSVNGIPIFRTSEVVNVSTRGRTKFSRREVVRRARQKLNRSICNPAEPDVSGYDLIDRNCEHFAYWCRTGEWRSFQIEDHLDS